MIYGLKREAIALRAAEAIALAMACLAPWAYGSVGPLARLGLALGTAGVVILAAIADGTRSRGRRLLGLTSLGSVGLVLLALLQAMPLPPGLLRVASPAAASLRAELLPAAPERVTGDPGPVVPLPLPRLSRHPGATLDAAASLAGAWLLLQGVLGLRPGFASLRCLAIAFSANAALLSLFSIVQASTWNGRIFWVGPITWGNARSVGGPFDHHTHLAECLNIGLGLTLALGLTGHRRDRSWAGTCRPWALATALLIAAGTIASNSRGGFLAMLAAGATVAVGSGARARQITGGVGSVVALVVMVVAILGGETPLAGRLASIADLGNEGYSTRLGIAKVALKVWLSDPVWGTGLGTFPVVTAPHQIGLRGASLARAENEYLDLLSEGGLIGLSLFAVAAIGVAGFARRGLTRATSPGDRALVWGAVFGVLALALNSLSDFGPHVAGVAVPALVLVGTLGKAGLEAEVRPSRRCGRTRPLVRLGWGLYGLATVLVGIGLAYRAWIDVRFEALQAEAGLARKGMAVPSLGVLARIGPDLERQRAALESALRLRPGWADGHLRLAIVDLIQCSRATTGKLAGEADDPIPILEAVFRKGRRGPVGVTRSFLEARRACLVAPLAQVGLASQFDVLVGGDRPTSYLERAERLAGERRGTLILAAGVAAGVGDRGRAARIWRRALVIDPENWTAVADSAAALLPPGRILDEVIPSGRLAMRFAGRLSPGTGDDTARESFLRAAIRRLPEDVDIEPGERLALEARAWEMLGKTDQALARMQEALVLKPGATAWRTDLVAWLLRMNRAGDAHEQALIGFHLDPESKTARQALDRSAEAMARQPGRPEAGAKPRYPPGRPPTDRAIDNSR